MGYLIEALGVVVVAIVVGFTGVGSVVIGYVGTTAAGNIVG